MSVVIVKNAKMKVGKVITTENFQNGLLYQTTVFMTKDNTEFPVVGDLAEWASATSYLIDVKRLPDSEHYNFALTARDTSKILEQGTLKGREFKKTIFIANADLEDKLPEVGDAVDWTRIADSYVLDYKLQACGKVNWILEIIAVEPGYDVGGISNG